MATTVEGGDTEADGGSDLALCRAHRPPHLLILLIPIHPTPTLNITRAGSETLNIQRCLPRAHLIMASPRTVAAPVVPNVAPNGTLVPPDIPDTPLRAAHQMFHPTLPISV